MIGNIKNMIKSNLSWILVLLFFVIFFIFFDRNAIFSDFDEWTHWGPMVKSMYYENKLFNLSSLNFIHKDYPPFVQLFEVLFCKMLGRYSESIVFFAFHILAVILIIPFFKSINSKKISDYIVCIISITFVFLLHSRNMNYLRSIYNDPILSVSAASTFFLIYKFNDTNINRAFITIFATIVLMTKEMGLAILIPIFMATVLISINKNKVYINNLFILIVPIITYVLFYMFKVTNNIGGGQFSIGNMLNNFIGYFKSGYDKEKVEYVFNNFIHTFTHQSLIYKKMPDTCLIWFFVNIVISFVIYKCFNNSYNNICVLISINIGYVVYTCVLAFIYMFSLQGVEATSLFCFNRYMQAYIFMSYLYFSYIILENIINNSYKTYQLIIKPFILLIPVIIFVFIFVNPLKIDTKFILKQWHPEDIETYSDVIKQAEYVKMNVPINEKLLVVNEGEYTNYYRFNYFAMPLYTSLISPGIPDGNIIFDKTDYSKEEINNIASNFDYIYVLSTDDAFINKYSKMLNIDGNDGTLLKLH